MRDGSRWCAEALLAENAGEPPHFTFARALANAKGLFDATKRAAISHIVTSASPIPTAPQTVLRFVQASPLAKAAEDLLIGAGWLPEPLRTPGQAFAPGIEPSSLAAPRNGGC